MNSNLLPGMFPRHRESAELTAGLAEICAAPRDVGTVELIVARPSEGQRRCLERVELTAAEGVPGDRWRDTSWLKLAEGGPDPAVQITLMNARCIQLIAGEREHWALAGDNLFVDFDLSHDNLPLGTRLRLGAAVLEIAEPPHNGCGKFKQRFGAAALAFVNSPEGKALRLRGVHCRVVQDGVVAVGDWIERIT